MQDCLERPQVESGGQGVLARLRAYVGTQQFVRLALVAILLLGASMRLTGVNWDEGTHLHPDERFLTDVTSRLGWPKSLAEYFDEARSPLNPYNRDVGMFVYGTAPIFLVKGLGLLLNKSSYWEVHLVGRVVSAGYDLLVIVLVFLIGRRLYGRWIGLLGAFLMACTVLNIQHSHFYTVENYITLMVTLAFLFAVRVMQGGGWGDWALLGASFGLAVAGKINMAMFALVIAAACLVRALSEPLPETWNAGVRVLWRRNLGPLSLLMQVNGRDDRAGRVVALQRGILRAGAGLALTLLIALVAFRVAQPYAFSGPSPFSLELSPRWLEDMRRAAAMMNGTIDMPPSHQWTDREPVWYALRNIVLWGMGLPLGLAAWLGWAVAGVELWRRRKVEHLLPLVWVTFPFLYLSIQFVKSIRYFLPFYPVLVLLGAYFIFWLWRQARRIAGAAGPAWTRMLARRAPAGAMVVAGVIVLGTFLYAEAFTNIYRRPLTRVAASRWVYENIPPGATITFEHWDDPIPQNVDGRDAGRYYNMLGTDPYWEDTPEKRDALYSWLDQADYIVLSSNRVYESIPRLPERFPLTTAYYRYLFSGDLGFRILRVFTSYPNLGPIELVDDRADETFTVYDHPKVIIFEKTAAYSSARVRELLGDIPVDRVIRLSPVQTMRSRHLLLLRQAELEAQRAGGTWSAMFNRMDLANRLPVLAWLAVTELLGLIALPIAYHAFPRLRDRGFIFAKGLGILLVSYLAWLAASLHLLPYTRLAIVAQVLLVLLVALWLARRRWSEMWAYLRREWRMLLLEEGLYLAFFGAFLLVRMGNPDLWHPARGGEKPMDLAYLNAIIKSTWFPPYDPWYAGGYINYYYFGHVLVATLIKLSGIVPTTAYNLVLPTLFALTAMGAYAVVAGLVGQAGGGGDEPTRTLDRAARFGLFGALLVTVLGNLGQVRLLTQAFQAASQLEFRSTLPGLAGLVRTLDGLLRVLAGRPLGTNPDWWFWNASRVMGAGEINEFPYFTFLYADLHAHLIALPFGLLALGLTVSLLNQCVGAARAAARSPEEPAGQGSPADMMLTKAGPTAAVGLPGRLKQWAATVQWTEWLGLTLLALVLGELRVNNTWDYPTYLLVAAGGMVIARMHGRRGPWWAEVWPVLKRLLFLALASTVLFQPFHARYGAAYTSVELWRGTRTPLGDYVVIHGVFLFILLIYALNRAFGYQARGALARSVRLTLGQPLRIGRYMRLADRLVQPGAAYQVGWLGIMALAAFSAASVMVHWWLVGLALPLLVVGMSLSLRRDLPAAEQFAAMLFSLGLVLTAAVEVVVLRGDIGRMNTVFKLYLQVWVLWGVAAAVALSALSRRWARWRPAWRESCQLGLGLLLLGAALYPLTATGAKINDRFDRSLGPGLDGTAYMQTAQYYDQDRLLELRHDLEAIRWLQDNVRGSPVILEAQTPLYRWGSRISIYTGLPTVIGWDWHQMQQRAVVPGEAILWRLDDVRRMYDTIDGDELIRLLRLYDVSYVYVGELEQAYYSPEGLAKFERLAGSLFDVVYRRGPVTIYQVRREQLGGLATRPFLLPQAGGSGKALLLSEPVDQLPVVADRGWNPLANAGPAAAVLIWWLAVCLLGWAAWPLLMGVCRGLPDRGYLLAKGAGWLIVGYLLWLGASTRALANRVPYAYAILGLLVVAGVWVARRQRRRLGALWRARRWLLLREEFLFSGAFLALVLVRLGNPDLWQPWFGGEKMMEFAYLNAILKSAHFPPYDPYFAGGYINYYYYGLYLVNVLIKLTGIVPEVAFNLAVPTFFALTVAMAFSLGHALTWRRKGRQWLWSGVAAAVGTALLANLTVLAQWVGGLVWLGGGPTEGAPGLEAMQPLLAGLARWLSGQGNLPAFDYWWEATRIIPNTINEFPFFSFLFADLHPHMMGMPFALGLLVALVALVAPGAGCGRLATQRRSDPKGWGTVGPLRGKWPLALLALIGGALGPLNTWDLPTYLGLAVVVLVWVGIERRVGWRACVQAMALVALAGALYAPFYAHYAAPSASPRFEPAQTRARYFLVVWGLWLVAAYGWLVPRWWRGRDGAGRVWRLALGPKAARSRALMRALGGGGLAAARLHVALAGAVLALTTLALTIGEAPIALLIAPVVLGLALWLRRRASMEERLGGLLMAAGCVVLAGTELAFLADFLQGGEWERMNTVFKFGIQAWLLLAVGLSAGLPEVLDWVRRRGFLPGAWAVAMVALVAISLAYVPLGVAARVHERFPGGPPPTGTLDGLAYMRTGVYRWPDEEHPIVLRHDYEAIGWLLANVRGTPVIAEAPLGYYREGGMRVSSYTGLPTLVGAHQSEQRPAEVVSERASQADALYRMGDPGATLALMRQLRVQYVYFGQLEEVVYGAASRAKFDELVHRGELEVAYENEGVRIYRVVGVGANRARCCPSGCPAPTA